MVAARAEQAEALKSILLHNDEPAYQKLFSAIKRDYTQIFNKLDQGYPVKIRLFDFVHQEILDQEEQKQFLAIHPKLDMHGGEALDTWPRLYREQVRTIFEALKWREISGDTPLEIMMPSVRTEKDVLDIKNIVREEAGKAGVEPGKYSFGVMIETLESCENIAKIAPHCDFISFGTNDLTQQLFDMSRSDLKAHAHFAEQHGFDPFKKLAPEILSLVETVVAKGRQACPGLKIDVCGAQAADPDTAAALCRAGVNNVSVAPSLGNLYGLPLLLNYKLYDSLPGKNKPAPGVSILPK
jgi:pyruvate,orthophosphate dikinase